MSQSLFAALNAFGLFARLTCPVDQAFHDAVCIGAIDIGFEVDANIAESCALVTVLDSGKPRTGRSGSDEPERQWLPERRGRYDINADLSGDTQTACDALPSAELEPRDGGR